LGFAAGAAPAATYVTSSATNSSGDAIDPGDSGYVNVLTFDAPGMANVSAGTHYVLAQGVSVTFAGDSGVFSSEHPVGTTAPSGLVGYWGAAKSGGDVTLNLAGYLQSHPGVAQVSFYWGSINPGDSVSLLNASGQVLETITGAQVSPATGNSSSPLTNLRIGLRSAALRGFAELRFAANGAPFDFGNVSVGGASATIGDPVTATPEPAAWALALVGLGMTGAALRMRTRRAPG
jgi:hypothetical protein